MHALQTQPTVSPTLIHHIQRGQIKVVPNIQVRGLQAVNVVRWDSGNTLALPPRGPGFKARWRVVLQLGFFLVGFLLSSP